MLSLGQTSSLPHPNYTPGSENQFANLFELNKADSQPSNLRIYSVFAKENPNKLEQYGALKYLASMYPKEKAMLPLFEEASEEYTKAITSSILQVMKNGSLTEKQQVFQHFVYARPTYSAPQSTNDFWRKVVDTLNADFAFIELDMREQDLVDANLSDLNLTRTNLSASDLTDANLSGAILYCAEFNYATLTNANMSEAFLVFAILDKATLINTNLNAATLTNASLSDADLTNANLANTHLQFVNLTQSNLTHTNLTKSDLSNARFNKANMSFTKLVKTVQGKADLTGAFHLNQLILEEPKTKDSYFKRFIKLFK